MATASATASATATATATVGGPVQDLSYFQMAPVPFLRDLTCSTHSPYYILKVKKNIDHNLPVGRVKCDIRVLGGCSSVFFRFLTSFKFVCPSMLLLLHIVLSICICH